MCRESREWGGAIPMPSRLESLVECHKFPQRGLGQSLAEIEFGKS